MKSKKNSIKFKNYKFESFPMHWKKADLQACYPRVCDGDHDTIHLRSQIFFSLMQEGLEIFPEIT